MNDLAFEYFMSGRLRDELNGCIPLREASSRTLDRVLGSMAGMSYLVISAASGGLRRKLNDSRHERLKGIVISRGFSFIPVKGGFRKEHKKSGNVVRAYEDALVVFPVGKNSAERTDFSLFHLGLELARFDPVQQDEAGNYTGRDPTNVAGFGQDFFLFKRKGKAPKCYKKDGAVESVLTDADSPLEHYFTRLADAKETDKSSFSFVSVYVPPEPGSLSERFSRYMKGELVNYYGNGAATPPKSGPEDGRLLHDMEQRQAYLRESGALKRVRRPGADNIAIARNFENKFEYVPYKDEGGAPSKWLSGHLERMSYLMVSAWDDGLDYMQNLERHAKMKAAAHARNFHFVPIQGLYSEGTRRNALIVFPLGPGWKRGLDFRLFHFGIDAARVFGQKWFLFKRSVPKKYGADGSPLGAVPDGADPVDEFFKALGEGFERSYFARQPGSMMGVHMRVSGGELVTYLYQ